MDENVLRLKIGTLVEMAMEQVRRDRERERSQLAAARKDPHDPAAVIALEKKQAEEAEMLRIAIEVGVQLVVDFHRMAEALEVIAATLSHPLQKMTPGPLSPGS